MYRYRIVKRWIDASRYPSLAKSPWIVEYRPWFWPFWFRCEFDGLPGMEFDTYFVSPENALKELKRYLVHYKEYWNSPTVVVDPKTLGEGS